MKHQKQETQLPIIQVTYQLALDLHRTVARFPRVHRASLGMFLTSQISAFLERIVVTNHLADNTRRLSSLKELMGTLLSVRLHLRMTRDLRCMSKGQFADFSRRLDDIQRQLVGWHKWVKSQVDQTK